MLRTVPLDGITAPLLNTSAWPLRLGDMCISWTNSSFTALPRSMAIECASGKELAAHPTTPWTSARVTNPLFRGLRDSDKTTPCDQFAHDCNERLERWSTGRKKKLATTAEISLPQMSPVGFFLRMVPGKKTVLDHLFPQKNTAILDTSFWSKATWGRHWCQLGTSALILFVTGELKRCRCSLDLRVS